MATPGSTYRVQLRPEFTLDDAAGIVDYLARLGVSHLYTSPDLQAAPGSAHGYDVVDHSRINAELGGRPADERLVRALEEHGLGRVVDVVPNHMAVSLPENRWFWEVLEHGPASRWASHFDVDWDPPESFLRNQVLMPILGDHYGRVIEAGELSLVHDGDGNFTIAYHDHVLPAAPRSLADVLERAGGEAGIDDLAFIGRALRRLPPSSATDPASRRERHGDVAVLARQLQRLLAEEPAVGRAIDTEVARINEDADALDSLLEQQNYRVAHWRTGREELDYRRFFDVDTLIGLRTEDPQVFADTHRLVLERVRAGEVDGLRIDHPDGLRRPGQYLRRLRDAAPEAWIVVEKILEQGEELDPTWPVDGTTGYEFLADVGALFVDPAGRAALTELWTDLTGDDDELAAVVHQAKHEVLRDVLTADLNRLTEAFVRVCEARRRYRDFTRSELSRALTETLACFSVYRTYVDEDGTASDEDRRRIGEAIKAAGERRDDLDPQLLDLLGRILGAEPDLSGPAEVELRMRFQQLSGPVMAKGVEDTAFYRYLRLASLNEVGGDPDAFGWPDVNRFHDRSRLVQERRPATMLALSTHDTKRSEDVRARLALLSEIPGPWALAVRRWTAEHGSKWAAGEERDPATEYLLYQTLVGAHPLPADRAAAYMEKATKEAKRRTSWIDPSPAFDQALAGLIEALLDDVSFRADLEDFVAPLVEPGRVNSLAQKLVQLTAPGVPDVYQGTELWDLSLVDPDNRRPVDYGLRRRLLEEVESAALDAETVWRRAEDGRPKLLVVQRALRLRADRPAAFGPGPEGRYEPLTVNGASAAHAVAFARGGDVVTVVPRLPLGLSRAGGWRDTTVELPPGRFRDVFSGAEHDGLVETAELLAAFPVALLARDRD